MICVQCKQPFEGPIIEGVCPKCANENYAQEVMGIFTVQTRDLEGGIEEHDTLMKALEYALMHPSVVWKISFSLPTGERVRLVLGRDMKHFELRQMTDELDDVTGELAEVLKRLKRE